jgi:hypothetical protein
MTSIISRKAALLLLLSSSIAYGSKYLKVEVTRSRNAYDPYKRFNVTKVSEGLNVEGNTFLNPEGLTTRKKSLL